MTFEEFVECIRVGVVAGAYDIKYVVNLLSSRGYATTRDVPEGQREDFMQTLDRYAND